jgi:hypothetical protein
MQGPPHGLIGSLILGFGHCCCSAYAVLCAGVAAWSLGLLSKMIMQLHHMHTSFFSWMPAYARRRGFSEGGKKIGVYFNLGNPSSPRALFTPVSQHTSPSKSKTILGSANCHPPGTVFWLGLRRTAFYEVALW